MALKNKREWPDVVSAGEYNLSISINLITPDNGEKFAVELSNATSTSLQRWQKHW